MTEVTAPGPAAGGRRRLAARWVAELSPGSFAFVMAGGIVSTAMAEEGAAGLSTALLAAACAGYAVLGAAHLWRLARWPRRVLADLSGPRGFAFLTVAAASGVLAGRLLAGHADGAAEALTGIAVATWLLLGYGVPLALVCAGRGLSLAQVNGAWFIWVVGTESVAVATASLAAHTGSRAAAALASVCWGVGLLQYLLIAALALARLLLEPVAPAQLVPPYWVFMGAAAISVLAGARLLRLPPGEVLPPPGFVLGVSAVLWAFCSWLVPLLLALGVWRHVLRRVPLPYETSLWSLVFPVGMYGVATREFGGVVGQGWLAAIGADEAWAALVVWAAVFAGMVVAAGRQLSRPPRAGN